MKLYVDVFILTLHSLGMSMSGLPASASSRRTIGSAVFKYNYKNLARKVYLNLQNSYTIYFFFALNYLLGMELKSERKHTKNATLSMSAVCDS
jgi:hypothetical protein